MSVGVGGCDRDCGCVIGTIHTNISHQTSCNTHRKRYPVKSLWTLILVSSLGE